MWLTGKAEYKAAIIAQSQEQMFLFMVQNTYLRYYATAGLAPGHQESHERSRPK